jgi:hypothetical protein
LEEAIRGQKWTQIPGTNHKLPGKIRGNLTLSSPIVPGPLSAPRANNTIEQG